MVWTVSQQVFSSPCSACSFVGRLRKEGKCYLKTALGYCVVPHICNPCTEHLGS